MKFIAKIFAVFLLLVSSFATADTLEQFFSNLNTYRAQFEQTTRDQYGTVVQIAQGELLLARPGRFRWDYQQPYEQLVMGDGKNLWSYDADLEQATVKPQSEVLAGSPAELLSQAVSPRELFRVVPMMQDGPLERYQLVPLNAQESGYSHIGMAFFDGELSSMELVDGFGQITEIRFLKPTHNVEVAPHAFVFELPDGADLIGQYTE